MNNYGVPIHWRRGLDIACGAPHAPAARIRPEACCRLEVAEADCPQCRDIAAAELEPVLDALRAKLAGPRHAAPPMGSAARESTASPYIGIHGLPEPCSGCELTSTPYTPGLKLLTCRKPEQPCPFKPPRRAPDFSGAFAFRMLMPLELEADAATRAAWDAAGGEPWESWRNRLGWHDDERRSNA